MRIGDGFRFGLGCLAAALCGLLVVSLLGATSWRLDHAFRARGKPYMITMCDAQTAGATGPCTNDALVKGAGNEAIAHRFSGAYTITLYGTQSTATSYSCDWYSNDTGYDADPGDVQKMNPLPLTHTSQVVSFAGLQDWGWPECTDITGGVVTITMLVSPL